MQAPRTAAHTTLVYRIVASLALASALGACGYKGPLYLPPPAAPDASLTTPPMQPTPANSAVDDAVQTHPLTPDSTAIEQPSLDAKP